MTKPLQTQTIALPETRELELLARMLEDEGATIARFPLISILDVEDPAPVIEWVRLLAAGTFDDVILFTGEGVRRIAARAKEAELFDGFLAGLSNARRITRGLKPIRALRELGLEPSLKADPPTTDGVINVLSEASLSGRKVGVQLYGTEPNEKLMAFLQAQGAEVHPVWPYRYASKVEDARVLELIDELQAGRLSLIAFTSKAQVDRLWEVATAASKEAALLDGLAKTKVAAIGPVAGDALAEKGVRVDAQPEVGFTLKPFVKAICRLMA